MNRADDILNRLKDWQPVVSEPDALTESIMDSIQDAPAAQSGGRHVIGAAFRIALSMAAVWLIGMFVFANYPAEQQQNNIAENIHATYESRSETIKKMYSARLQKNKSNQLTYTQLKRILYENR